MRREVKAWIETTPESPWEDKSQEAVGSALVSESAKAASLEIEDRYDQSIDGFGGCFNELGMAALRKLPEPRRKQALAALFGPDEGCGFSLCRLPIGASDYSEGWYSYDEHPGDFGMDHFTIERDRESLIPFVKAAQALCPGLRFFASPWSPPTWMKSPAVYNFGRLMMEREVLDAYALYLLRYLRAYREEGIDVERLHIQNEPFADQKFPSCLWSAEQFIVFIRDYLGPLFEREKEKVGIWLGTLNGPELMSFMPDGSMRLSSYDDFVDRILLDEGARKRIAGIGFQWAGRANVQRTHQAWPEIPIMQTENECGDGRNSWEYAFYVFNLMQRYFINGASSYAYWNMILEPEGKSSWGWRQNSMITVDPEAGDFRLNPEYYVMKHFSRFVAFGARRKEARGRWCGSSIAFENPDGALVVIAANLQPMARPMAVVEGGERCCIVSLAPRSINTLVVVQAGDSE